MKLNSAFGIFAMIALGTTGCSSQTPEPSNSSGSSQVPSSPSAPQHSPEPAASPAKETPPNKPMPALSDPSHVPQPRTFPPPSQSAPLRENPTAAPPMKGEMVAKDFKIESGDRSVEVEGVCKLTEDEAVCWKPNGDSNSALAQELTNAIKSKTDSYSGTFQFRFQKKNRILVLRTVTAPPKPNSTGSSMNGGVLNQDRGSDSEEGWTNHYSPFSSASSTGFDQSRTERQILTGAFNRDTTTFPLRYQIMEYSTGNRKSIPFKKGFFDIEGNTYEITSISDQPENNPAYRLNPGMNSNIKRTSIAIKIVKLTNPNIVVTMAA